MYTLKKVNLLTYALPQIHILKVVGVIPLKPLFSEF